MTIKGSVYTLDGKPVRDLYVKTDISPEQIFQAIGRLRKEAREEIDRLIQFLDSTDEHMEREPDDDEPEEWEPSLGSLDRAMDQSRWSAGRTDDSEHDDCDREDDDPNEEKQQPPEMCA